MVLNPILTGKHSDRIIVYHKKSLEREMKIPTKYSSYNLYDLKKGEFPLAIIKIKVKQVKLS